MAFALSPFAYRKRITERCSLRDAYSGNSAVSNVYKCRHSDALILYRLWRFINHLLTYLKLQLVLRIKSPTKCIFQNFHILKTDRMMLFRNLFMERPSHYAMLLCC